MCANYPRWQPQTPRTPMPGAATRWTRDRLPSKGVIQGGAHRSPLQLLADAEQRLESARVRLDQLFWLLASHYE